MHRTIRHPIETFRTAPVYLSTIVGSLAIVGFSSEAAFEMKDGLEYVSSVAFAASYLGAAMYFTRETQKKIKFRDRIESVLEEYGFDERVMNPTTRDYCSRQAARVACENSGYFDDYKELCEQNSDTDNYTWLPHI